MKNPIFEESYEEIKSKVKVGTQTVHATYLWLHKGDEKYTAWLKLKVLEGKSKNKTISKVVNKVTPFFKLNQARSSPR